MEEDVYYDSPSPEALAKASEDELRRCKLSRQKARYIRRLAAVTWGLLTVVPIIAIPLAIYPHKDFMITGGISLAGFLALTVINQLGRKKGCARCKMRYVCVASATR